MSNIDKLKVEQFWHDYETEFEKFINNKKYEKTESALFNLIRASFSAGVDFGLKKCMDSDYNPYYKENAQLRDRVKALETLLALKNNN